MDLQFVQLNNSLPVSGTRLIPNMQPPSLEIHGIDFSSAIDVLINDSSSPSFVVASSNIIIAQIPTSALGDMIDSLVIVSSDFTANVSSLITYKLGDDTKKATGLKALMQMYIKILLTTPGYDSFTKKIGGGVLELVGSTADNKQNPITASLAIGVRQAADQICAMQARSTRLPDEERLLGANLVGMSFDSASSALLARVELYTQSGTQTFANLEF